MTREIKAGDIVELKHSYPCIKGEHVRGIVKTNIGIEDTTRLPLWTVVIPRKYILALTNKKNNIVVCNESEMMKVR
jgi:hypothetical protein